MRYRCTDPTLTSYKYVSYLKISKALGVPYNTVQHLCRHALKPKRPPARNREVTKLEQHHIDFLTSYKTLEDWAGFTLKWRTKLFHRRFPDKRIAVTCLRRLYLKHGIKRKKVRQEKHMPQHARLQYQANCRLTRLALERAEQASRLIVYLDEIVFSKSSVISRDWSARNSNLAVDQTMIYTGYTAVIASMTKEKGIGPLKLYPKALTAEEFIEFLKELRREYGRRPLSLFMDNLYVHKSRAAREHFEKLNIEPIWNVSYSPEFNPIEAVFSKVKAIFKRRRLNALVRKIRFNTSKNIIYAFK